MPWITWIVGGFVAGWLTGFTRKGRGYGLLGNLLIGMAGGLVGGWIFRSLGVQQPLNLVAHVLVSMIGGILLATSVRLLDAAARRAGALAGGAPGAVLVSDIEAQIKRLGHLEQRVLAQFLHRRPVARDPNQVFDAQVSFGHRLADQVAGFGGSWTFILLFTLVITLWILANVRPGAFDPYPFILLNLVLSTLAALQAPVIMMSQNRQAAKDRLAAQNDYEVNLKAEMEIIALHAKLDALREGEQRELAELHEHHDALVGRLERLLRQHEGNA
jgi:uncharacterized membrane protein/uncharacterized membrane protein YeaQ/YmgE (transglycosylase-associated protein family)